MRIEHHEREAVDVLSCFGRQAAAVEAEELRDRVDHLVDLGEPIVVLDLSELDTVDGVFVDATLSCHERIVEADGLLKLVVRPDQRKLFAVEGRAPVEMFDVEDEAIDSFDAETMTYGIP